MRGPWWHEPPVSASDIVDGPPARYRPTTATGRRAHVSCGRPVTMDQHFRAPRQWGQASASGSSDGQPARPSQARPKRVNAACRHLDIVFPQVVGRLAHDSSFSSCNDFFFFVLLPSRAVTWVVLPCCPDRVLSQQTASTASGSGAPCSILGSFDCDKPTDCTPHLGDRTRGEPCSTSSPCAAPLRSARHQSVLTYACRAPERRPDKALSAPPLLTRGMTSNAIFNLLPNLPAI